MLLQCLLIILLIPIDDEILCQSGPIKNFPTEKSTNKNLRE
jgi:hypothetical protein